MNIDDIIAKRNTLNRELRIALSTMERSNKINEIKAEIRDNQAHCPHISSKYNWSTVDGECPYCGYIFDRGREY